MDLEGSSPRRKRRATPVSRGISRRNVVFRRSLKEAMEDGQMEEMEARDEVTRAIRSPFLHFIFAQVYSEGPPWSPPSWVRRPLS